MTDLSRKTVSGLVSYFVHQVRGEEAGNLHIAARYRYAALRALDDDQPDAAAVFAQLAISAAIDRAAGRLTAAAPAAEEDS